LSPRFRAPPFKASRGARDAFIATEKAMPQTCRDQVFAASIFEIDRTTVTMVIGLLASLIAVVFYARRDRD